MLTRKTTTWPVVLAALALVWPAAAAAWTWPADGPVLRGFAFGWPEYRAHGHTGIDIGAAPGSPVRAPAYLLRRLAARERTHGHDQDRGRLCSHAAPSGLDRRGCGRRGGRGRGGRDDRPLR